MRIFVCKYGESVFSERYLYQGGRPEVLLPISFCFYLLETDGRRILVDVGCNDGAGFPMSVFVRPAELLRTSGIEPDTVTDVFLTHHHHDHAEAAADFPQAIFYVQREEYRKAGKYIPADARIRLFEDTLTLAEGVSAQRIGGHTAGSSILVCSGAEATYVLCGDECYVADCLTRGIPTGASHDPAVSAAFVAEYGQAGYVPLLFHDPAILPGRVGVACVAELHEFESF